ncbi:hypothetical protein B0J14DRAFT_528407 [Halenospora varia]|nr:hypothetical protein B0J14DRAFT_528407 [Halenospora varia]
MSAPCQLYPSHYAKLRHRNHPSSTSFPHTFHHESWPQPLASTISSLLFSEFVYLVTTNNRPYSSCSICFSLLLQLPISSRYQLLAMADDVEPASPPLSDHSDDDDESDIELNYDQPAIAAPEDEYFQSLERPHIPATIRELGILLNSKRRTAVDSLRGAASAWIDLDDSGTYNPKGLCVTPPKKPKRARISRPVDDGNAVPKTRKPYRKVGYGFLVTLKFTEQKSLDYLRSITPHKEDPHGSDIDDESDSNHYDVCPNLVGVRTRRSSKQTKRQGITNTRADGLTLDDLTEGHPQRRGCKGCFLSGDDDCSLIHFGEEYPCTACEDTGIDCEYIISPELKKSCEGCKRKRITCSFRGDGGKGVDICDACEEDDEPCCAAPLQKSAYSKRFENPDSETEEVTAPTPASRRWVACNECRDSDSRCSLKRDQAGPCARCRKNGRNCTFVLAPSKDTSRSPKFASHNPKSGKRQVQRPLTPPDPTRQQRLHSQYTPNRLMTRTLLTEAAGKYSKKNEKILNKGLTHIRIKTFFAHPLVFNYTPDPEGKAPCSWCDSPFFGLWGHGEVDVEVIPWGGAVGNEEIDGGHTSGGKHENSKMCITCTFARLRVTLCTGHKIRQIKGLDVRSFNLVALVESFSALTGHGDKSAGELAMSAKWCSICVSLAQYECCAPQCFNENGELIPEGQPHHIGCGLYLCSTCKELLDRLERSRGARTQIIDELVKWRKSELWQYNQSRNSNDWDWVRADAEFLTSSGELMIRMRQIEEATQLEKEDVEDENMEVDIPGMFKKESLAKRGKGKGKHLEASGFGSPLKLRNHPVRTTNPARTSTIASHNQNPLPNHNTGINASKKMTKKPPRPAGSTQARNFKGLLSPRKDQPLRKQVSNTAFPRPNGNKSMASSSGGPSTSGVSSNTKNTQPQRKPNVTPIASKSDITNSKALSSAANNSQSTIPSSSQSQSFTSTAPTSANTSFTALNRPSSSRPTNTKRAWLYKKSHPTPTPSTNASFSRPTLLPSAIGETGFLSPEPPKAKGKGKGKEVVRRKKSVGSEGGDWTF